MNTSHFSPASKSAPTAIMAAVAIAAQATHAQVTWDGDCGNAQWTSQCGPATNWNTNQFPTLTDPVSLTADNPVVTAAGGEAMTISCESGLTVAGLLTLAAGGTIQNLTVNNALLGIEALAGDLVLTGSPNWIQGHFGGAGILKNQGAMTGHSIALDDFTVFENHATYEYTGGLVLSAAASLKNKPGAVLTMRSTLGAGGMVGQNSFHNDGIFRAQYNGASLNGVGPIYVQSASGQFIVDAQSATNYSVNLGNGAVFSGGTVSIGENASLHLWAPGVPQDYIFEGPTTITGEGSMVVELSSFNQTPEMIVLSDLDVTLTGADGLRMQTGRIKLGATLNNYGRAEWAGSALKPTGTGSPLFHNHGLEFTIEGPTSAVTLETNFLNSGLVEQRTGTDLIIAAGGVFTNDGEYANYKGEISDGIGGGGNFINDGFFKKPDDPITENSTVQPDFNLTPTGTVQVESGILTFNALHVEGGSVQTSHDAETRLSGSHTVTAPAANPGVFSGEGLCRITTNGTIFRVEPGAKVVFNHAGAEDARLQLESGARMGGPGEIVNDGTFFWDGGIIGVADAGGGGGFDAHFINNGQTIITDGGTVHDSAGERAGEFAAFTNNDEVTQVDGAISFLNNAVIANLGEWTVADPNGGTALSGMTGLFVNAFIAEFIVDVPQDQQVQVAAPFSNFGTVRVREGSLAFIGPVLQLSDGRLYDGAWMVEEGGSLDLPGTLTSIEDETYVDARRGEFNDLKSLQHVDGDADLLLGDQDICDDPLCAPDLQGLQNDGSTTVEPPDGGGGVTVDGEVHNSIFGKFGQGYVVPSIAGEGGGPPIGLTCTAFINDGRVLPGGENAPGPFGLDGDFIQSSTGTLEIELGGELPVEGHDQLIVDGNVNLGGTLHAMVLPGYLPTGGEQFTIVSVSSGAIKGTFDQVTGPGQYSVAYGPTSVVLTLVSPPVPGDLNGDGVVSPFDLAQLLASWGACPGDKPCLADLNGDGAVGPIDLATLLANWG
jgi:hypothetical protein